MYCEDCRKYALEKHKSNYFVIGNENFKMEAVKDHKNSKSHLQSLTTKQTKCNSFGTEHCCHELGINEVNTI